MDWIKVKTRHIDYDFFGQPADTGWAWIQLMSMTAALERIPSEEQMKQRVGEDIYVRLTEVLQKSDTTIEEVLDKVMEDVEKVENRKSHNREYMADYRKDLRNEPRGQHVKGKIREEKSREDKKKLNKPFLDFKYLEPENIKKLFKLFDGKDGVMVHLKGMGFYEARIAEAFEKAGIK